MRSVLRVFSAVLLSCSSASFAAGWTGYGTVKELGQQPKNAPADIVVVADIASNGTKCAVKDKFLFDIQDSRDERVYSTLLTALVAQKEVRFFLEDDCSVWDMPKITGIYIR
ncbi:hypothetical protein [Pseudoalteromonas rubra]|uniref:hypothetical protein n=1 Tax=Pseudoalteromonas rubra TaxID=43658 RepID=UPI000F7ADE4C|nr:hypothetical protein [Pseudoalteromonas rubra]